MGTVIEGSLDAKGLRVGLVVSRFNEAITSRLLQGAEDCLERHGCPADQRTIVRVPGAWEIPLAAKAMAGGGQFDAIVALGALIRGDTAHFELIAAEVSKGLGQVSLQCNVPIAFGVLTTDTAEQALDRSGAKAGNKGWEAALSAVEMVNLLRRMA